MNSPTDFISIYIDIGKYIEHTFLIDSQADISLIKISCLKNSFDLNTDEIIRIRGISEEILSS